MNKEKIKEFILSKNKPISSCKDLHKHFIGRHKVIPVYLTPKFEMELECIMNKLEDLEKENKKNKEVINKAIELLGNYKHYSTPDEEQNSDNEDLVNKAFDILKEVKDK